jgi:hypothetical protein
VAAVLVAAAPLRAQAPVPRSATMVWLDAGGARVQQPTSTRRSAGSLGGGVWHARSRVALAAEGSMTLASDSVRAGQYVVRVTLLPWAVARTDVDLSATTNGGGVLGLDGNRALAGWQHLRVGPLELSAFAGVGRTTRANRPNEGRRLGGAVAWQRATPVGTLRAGAHYARGWTDDFRLMEAARFGLRAPAPAYTLADRQLDASWQHGPLWVQGSRAWRAGTGATRGTASAFHLAAAWNLKAGTSLIAQVGEQLADVVRGVPQARYTGLGMRWTPVRPATMRRDARALGDDRGGTVGITTVPDMRGDEVLVQRREGHGEVSISLLAAIGAVVEIASSSTEWKPVRAPREGDRFVYRFPLPSGTHRVAVRVNGGEWRAPRGLAVVDDDFGGKAGLIVIP